MLPSFELPDYFAALRGMLDEHLRAIAERAAAPRPLAEALGRKPKKLLDAAAAMEMIHTSSLILDDLPSMDDAQLRRGAPALHRQFGEDLAILTSVGLLNQAYGLVARNHGATN